LTAMQVIIKRPKAAFNDTVDLGTSHLPIIVDPCLDPQMPPP
jgi:hypothetical protein